MMVPPIALDEGTCWARSVSDLKPYDGPPRNIGPINQVDFDKSLTPENYNIFGTHSGSKTLILDVHILESTGREPYHGDVLIEGERFTAVGTVPNKDELKRDPRVCTFYGRGRTLMSGMGDAHTHLSWNGGDLARLGELNVEEHTLLTAKSAQCYLDSGYTMCWGAASAKDRLDVVTRNAVNTGDIPGPRYLANAKEICRSEGDLVPGISAYADGPEAMREVIRRHVALGADQIKLSMSGEAIAEGRPAEECYFNDEETAACVDEAHKHGRRLCAHARGRDSVAMCIRHGVDVIFHASYIDDQGMDMLEANKTKHIVVPALNFPINVLEDGERFGYPRAQAEQVGYKRELDAAVLAMREMHRRGIVVLPGGDYGFAWTPHGTYARDLAHFTNLLGFTAHEAIIAATAGVAQLFMRQHELGKVQPGYYADCVLVDGDPLSDIEILQDHSRLNIIVINGRVHKAGVKEYLGMAMTVQRESNGTGKLPDLGAGMEFPEVKKVMQKDF